MNNISDYTSLLTSYHRDKPKLNASIMAVLQPLLDCRQALTNLPGMFDVDTATGDQLRIIAQWVGAPLAIPNVTALPFFGFEGQDNSLTFGETDNPAAGGFWRESGVNSFTAVDVPPDILRKVVLAQIYKNRCECLTADAYQIIGILTSIPVRITDTQQMSINVIFQATASTLIVELVRIMYPRPMGVSLTISGN